MSQQLPITHSLAVLAIAFTFAGSAQAAASRSFVATTGNDTNTSANCGAVTPCRSFAAALSVTNPGGEVVVLNSGGYGPATITQPVTMTAIGIDASITQTTAGDNGLTINTAGDVTITGLNLDGGGTGENGVYVEAVGVLRLYSMHIQNFVNTGIYFLASGDLAVYDSNINDSQDGFQLANSSAQGYVHNTEFSHNDIGAIALLGGKLAIADSSAQYNEIGFDGLSSAVALYNDRIIFNGQGIAAIEGGVVDFAGCLISGNTTAYFINGGGTIAGSNPGTSLITSGQATHGTLSTPIVLQ